MLTIDWDDNNGAEYAEARERATAAFDNAATQLLDADAEQRLPGVIAKLRELFLDELA